MGFVKSGKKEDEFKYEIIKDYGDIGKPDEKGVVKKLRLISYNGGEPKYDIHPWYTNEDGKERMYKGITLTGEEAETLMKLLLKVANED